MGAVVVVVRARTHMRTLAGDMLLKVGGISVSSFKLRELATHLLGQEGSDVELSLVRESLEYSGEQRRACSPVFIYPCLPNSYLLAAPSLRPGVAAGLALSPRCDCAPGSPLMSHPEGVRVYRVVVDAFVAVSSLFAPVHMFVPISVSMPVFLVLFLLC